MAVSAVIAHAGHPAEWLPFVAPLVLVAVAWFVIRARDAAAAEGAPDPDDARHDEPRGEEEGARPADEPAEKPERMGGPGQS